MGVIRRGLLGGFSGRVGNIVGSSWKGIAVIKSLPLSVANPQTTGQVTQRNKFSLTVDFSTKILSAWIKPLWDRFASQMSGYNAFVSKNVKLCDPNNLLQAYGFVLSSGKMPEVADIALVVNTENKTLNLSWNTDLHGSYETNDDSMYILLTFEDMPDAVMIDSNSNRSDGSVILSAPTGTDLNKKVGVAICARRPDGTVVSDSTLTYMNL